MCGKRGKDDICVHPYCIPLQEQDRWVPLEICIICWAKLPCSLGKKKVRKHGISAAKTCMLL